MLNVETIANIRSALPSPKRSDSRCRQQFRSKHWACRYRHIFLAISRVAAQFPLIGPTRFLGMGTT
jgi:hypothetical protein